MSLRYLSWRHLQPNSTADIGAARLLRSPAAGRAPARRSFGFSADDRGQPYAHFMKDRVDPPQQHVLDALAAGPTPARLIPSVRRLADDLHAPGYSVVETGYGRLKTGEVWVACLTDMPRVRPEMWDWWFAWHGRETARYRLWHPESHAFSATRFNRAGQEPPSSQYLENTFYVDEVIGGHLDQLAITFQDPRRFGIDIRRFNGTAICARVGTALAPVNVGLLCHQVRATPGGAEMRSRFYLNVPGIRAPDPDGITRAVRRGIAPPRSIVFGRRFGADLLRHCGEEMNHLAGFLPELYAEFGPGA